MSDAVGVRSMGRAIDRWAGLVLGIVAGLAYLALGPDKRDLDSHYPVAQAFLAGRLHLVDAIPWLELVPRSEGGWYSPFPPLLSALLVPFAATGVVVDSNHLAAVFGGLSVALVWAMLARLEVERRPRLALTVGWAFGSQLLWVAAEGGQHLAPQAAAAALLLASIVLGLGRRAPVVAGLLFAGAVAARLPVGLAMPLLLYLYRPGGEAVAGGDAVIGRHTVALGEAAVGGATGASGRTPRGSRSWRPWVGFLAAAAIPFALVAMYNMVRFGSPAEFGYGLIRNVAGESVLDEPWYRHGIVSVRYLPQGIHAMLFRGLEWQDAFPWIYGSLAGTSVLLTMPILWWVFGARGRLALVAAISAILVLLPDLMHGNPGFAQIGYRFVLDALPLLWLLLGLSLRSGLGRPAAAALAAGVLVNAWLCIVHWSELVPEF